MDLYAGINDLLVVNLHKDDAQPINLPVALLKVITKDFSDDLLIGSGGFAEVYMGLLGNGETVAVKKLLNTIGMDDDKFQQEVACLMMARHKNIVQFLGYCADTQGKMHDYEGKFIMADERTRLLCFEYLRKGSLEKYISDASSGLDWRVRYKIIKGICEGLHFLHEMNIVHLDLKPDNILLNDIMVPKISDFGLSRLFDAKQTRAITSNLVGTLAYVAPEFHDGVITKKSDIYSLGIIIAEILTGKKGHSRVEDVIECWTNRFGSSVSEMNDQLKQIKACAKVRLSCANPDPEKRPDTKQIINILSEPNNEFPEVDFDEVLEGVYSSMAKARQEQRMASKSESKYSWWWDSNIPHQNNRWLEENMAEMNAKVKQSLRLIDTDADTFARRAEIYYRSRPELVGGLEQIYRSYLALAERYGNLTVEYRRSVQMPILHKSPGTSESSSATESTSLTHERPN